MLKLHTGSIKLLFVSFIILLVIAALAVPTIAAAQPGDGSPPPEADGNRIEGTAEGSVVFLADDASETITLEMPAETVCAIYTTEDEVNTLKSLRVILDPPEDEETDTPEDLGWIFAQGLVSDGPITITSTDGETVVELVLPEDSVRVVYSESDDVYTLEGLNNGAGKPEHEGNEQQGTCGTVSGGPITITSEDGLTVVDLEMPEDTVRVTYSESDSVYTLTGLRICRDPDAADDEDTEEAVLVQIQGTATGTITFVAEDSEDEIVLEMPEGTVYASYNEEDSTFTLESFSLHQNCRGPEKGQDQGRDKGPGAPPSVEPPETTASSSDSIVSNSAAPSQDNRGNQNNRGKNGR